MSRLLSHIEELARPVVEEQGAFLVAVSVRGEHGRRIVEVFIDTDVGVTTELCSEVSRSLSTVFETVINGAYDLVVSSPGLDRPLRFARQYPKHLGRVLIVKVSSERGTDRIEGELVEVQQDGVVLKVGNDVRTKYAFDDIREARVKPRW